MNLLFARQADGFRCWFTVSKNGILRAALTSGVFTAVVVNPADSTSATYTVSESTQKPGLYLFDVPTGFLVANGAGEYAVTVEVAAVAPRLDAVASGILIVSLNDLDSLPQDFLGATVVC